MATRQLLWSIKGVRLTLSNVFPTTFIAGIGGNPNFLYDRPQCSRFLSTTEEDWLQEPAKPKKRKTVPIPKITLVMPDQSIMVTDQESASRISKRRQLQLVSSGFDKKSERPIYKLIDNSVYLKNETKYDSMEDKSVSSVSNKQKSEKIIQINPTITEGHLLMKLKHANKLLAKGHSIKFLLLHKGKKVVHIHESIKKEIEGYGTISKIIEKERQSSVIVFPIRENKNINEDYADKSRTNETNKA